MFFCMRVIWVSSRIPGRVSLLDSRCSGVASVGFEIPSPWNLVPGYLYQGVTSDGSLDVRRYVHHHQDRNLGRLCLCLRTLWRRVAADSDRIYWYARSD